MKSADELKRAIETGEPLEGYEHVAAGYVWLVEQGARFWLSGTAIVFRLPKIGCIKCAQEYPAEDWKTDYYVDIIYPNLVATHDDLFN